MHNKASFALSICIMVAAAYAVIAAWDWPWKAALFPLAIGIPVFLLAGTEAVWGLLGKHAQASDVVKDYQLSDHLPPRETLRRTGIAIAWTLAFFVMIVLLGFPIAVPLFVFLYLKIPGREGWVFSAIFTLIVWAVFYGLFDMLLHLPFPDGWLLEWLHLAD